MRITVLDEEKRNSFQSYDMEPIDGSLLTLSEEEEEQEDIWDMEQD